MKKFLLLIPLALLLGACGTISDWFDTGREYAGKGAAAAVEAECNLSLSQRAENLAAVNAALEARGVAFRASALDCDGDGSADDLTGA